MISEARELDTDAGIGTRRAHDASRTKSEIEWRGERLQDRRSMDGVGLEAAQHVRPFPPAPAPYVRVLGPIIPPPKWGCLAGTSNLAESSPRAASQRRNWKRGAQTRIWGRRAASIGLCGLGVVGFRRVCG